MSAFALNLLDGRSVHRIDGVTSLVASDAFGAFGVLAGHEPLVTVLEPGLLRWRRAAPGGWTFAACAGGLLRCAGGGEVTVVSSRFVQGADLDALQQALGVLVERETTLRVSSRESQERLDTALVKRLQEWASRTSSSAQGRP